MAMRRLVRQRGAHRIAAALLAASACAPRAGAAEAPVRWRESVRIELRPEVEVKGPQVLLGEIAVLGTLDLPLLERLMSLPLGPAPRAGTGVRLERIHLLRWIRARTGLAPEQIAWVGPEAAVVRAAVGRVSGEELARAATVALREELDVDGVRATVGQPAVPNDQNVPAGEVELRARPVPRAALLTGRPSVWVDVWVDGRFARTVPVAFDLTLDRAVPEAAGPRVAVRPVAPPRVGAGLAVARGSTASLRAVVGRIAVESRVEVLEDGKPGQLVRVRLPGADTPVLARVVGPRAVEVEQ
jgi:flagella basal body P-ring formation protein FlgA